METPAVKELILALLLIFVTNKPLHENFKLQYHLF